MIVLINSIYFLWVTVISNIPPEKYQYIGHFVPSLLRFFRQLHDSAFKKVFIVLDQKEFYHFVEFRTLELNDNDRKDPKISCHLTLIFKVQ